MFHTRKHDLIQIGIITAETPNGSLSNILKSTKSEFGLKFYWHVGLYRVFE